MKTLFTAVLVTTCLSIVAQSQKSPNSSSSSGNFTTAGVNALSNYLSSSHAKQHNRTETRELELVVKQVAADQQLALNKRKEYDQEIEEYKKSIRGSVVDCYCRKTGILRCLSCGGTGFPRCNYCNGSGRASYGTCSACHGAGKEYCFICTGFGVITCDLCKGNLVSFYADETWLRDQAVLGNEIAQSYLLRHSYSIDTLKVRWATELAMKGNIIAMFSVAKHSKDTALAHKYLFQAADLGHFEAIQMIDGDLLKLPVNVSPANKIERIFKWTQHAAATGDPNAIYSMAQYDIQFLKIYYSCTDDRGDPDFKDYFNLGVYYEKGIGVKKNWKEAAKWYLEIPRKDKKYSKVGVYYSLAQLQAGKLYETGAAELPKNISKARKLYAEAAEAGNEEAAALLAKLGNQ